MAKKTNPLIPIALLIIVVACLFLFKKDTQVPSVSKTDPIPAIVPISITEDVIKEDNFSGTRPLIAGSGAVANAARKYVEQSISVFKGRANEEVPDIRAHFGSDSPVSQYTIDIKATHVKSASTESIIIDTYAYTGGANGNSTYKVFTGSLSKDMLLSLSDVIKKDQQKAFTAYVKKELLAWRPEGMEQTVVFPEDVKALTFASFTDWSLGDESLTLYFDKYKIGPGALGAVDFPLPISAIESYLSEPY